VLFSVAKYRRYTFSLDKTNNGNERDEEVLYRCSKLGTGNRFNIMERPDLAGEKSYDSIRYVPSEDCAECHEEIYEQWKGSMHAKSSALNDPIHATFYKAVVGNPSLEDVKTKAGKYPVCL